MLQSTNKENPSPTQKHNLGIPPQVLSSSTPNSTRPAPTLPVAQPVTRSVNPKTLNIFEFTDYRFFLGAFYESKKDKNPSYSMSAFARKAGLGHNSRGYLKLVMEGKRNLTPHTLRSFSDALNLNPKESLYFENLVYFNQAKKSKDKEYYFQRLVASAEGKETQQFEILKSQHNYYSHWYVVAVRELVALAEFKEDPAWIVSQLRGKISKQQAAEALIHLERLGMIKREESGKLVQSEPLVKYATGTFNYTVQKFQSEMLDRAKESLEEDDYDERDCSSITVSCNREHLPEMKKMVSDFRDQMCMKFGLESEMETKKPDSVFQVGLQLFQLTPIKKNKSKQEETKNV